MKYLPWLGVASLVLILTGCASSRYNSGTPGSSQYYDATDFNGDWHLVTSRSDDGREWLDERNRFGTDDWGTTDRTTDRMRYGAWFLPDEFRIDGDRRTLRIVDEGGDLIAQIDLEDSDYRSGAYDDRDDVSRGVRARWVSDRKFEVERTGRRGRRITQTYTIENRGRSLVVGTQVERDGSTRSYTRVYDRT